MNVFNHSGAQGDIIYSLPTIRKLGGGILNLNLPDVIVKNLYPLLSIQEYIHGIDYSDFAITHDLDLFRKQELLAFTHLSISHLKAFNLDLKGWNEPWIRLPNEDMGFGGYAVVNRTPRYPSAGFDWDKEIEYLKDTYGTVYFVGDEQDNIFILEHVKFTNALHLSMFIKGAQMFTGNPSLCVALAEGMGRTYRMVQPDGITNCNMYTPNETILNP